MAIDKNAKGINLDLYRMMVKLACNFYFYFKLIIRVDISSQIFIKGKKKLHQVDGV
jgi:hypothetical protein